jgi:hypothetical protein
MGMESAKLVASRKENFVEFTQNLLVRSRLAKPVEGMPERLTAYRDPPVAEG